jgi:hypothetical protein
MKLTQRQLDVLNHVVEDGQVWADKTSEKNMFAKVARHESAYDEAVAKGNYLNRKQRDEADAVVAQERYDNVSYDVKRSREYAKLNQFEMQFDDQRDGTTTWVDAINGIKEKHPKE